jgi:hypothetical protein
LTDPVGSVDRERFDCEISPSIEDEDCRLQYRRREARVRHGPSGLA